MNGRTFSHAEISLNYPDHYTSNDYHILSHNMHDQDQILSSLEECWTTTQEIKETILKMTKK